jgi:hypothetical protein
MVAEYVKKIMAKGISNFAKESKRTIEEVQLLISWDEENNKPKFKKMVFEQPSVDITFNQVLGVKFDILNREMIVNDFITKTMAQYAEEFQCPITSLFIIISYEIIDEDENEDVKLYLHKGNQMVKELQLEQLLT